MQSKLVAEAGGRRTFVLVFEPGEEAFSTITRFAADNHITAASLTGLDAFARATVGWFEPHLRHAGLLLY
jgi:uncharacterized protein